MKKLCLNVPRKTTTLIQVGVSMFLLVLCVILSFGPIITLDLAEEDTVDSVNKYLEELISTEIPDIPAKVDVTAGKVVTAVRYFSKAITAMVNAGKPKGDKASEELEEMTFNEDGTLKESMKDTILLVAVCGRTIANDSSSSSFAVLLKLLVNIFALFLVLVLTVLMPIMCIIFLLAAIAPAVKSLKDYTVSTTKVATKLVEMLPLPLVLMLLQAMIPGLNYGSSTVWITICAIVNVVLNTVLSRCRDYSEEDLTLANIAQGISVVSIIGFLIFFFNIIKTGIVSEFIEGPWTDYTVLAKIAKDNGLQVSNGYYIDGILVYLNALLILTIVGAYILLAARRLSLTCKKGKRGNGTYIGTSCIVLTAIAIVTTLIPRYLMSSGHNELGSETASSFLTLSDAQTSALTVALVGAIVMLASEIAIVVLKGQFCPRMTDDDVEAVLEGRAKTPEEKVAIAKEILEQAKATVENQQTEQ